MQISAEEKRISRVSSVCMNNNIVVVKCRIGWLVHKIFLNYFLHIFKFLSSK